jgi:formyltetrahydrofolate deformylase
VQERRQLEDSNSVPDRRYVITFGCPDRTGIIAGISGFLAAADGWIVDAAYHTDRESGWFFTRQEVLAASLPYDVTELRARFARVAAELAGPGGRAEWRISDTAVRRRVVILTATAPSSSDHPCRTPSVKPLVGMSFIYKE